MKTLMKQLLATSHLLFVACFLAVPQLAAGEVDLDNDGYTVEVDCDDDNPAWHDECTLSAYTACTNENQFIEQCLPNVSNVEIKLAMLNDQAMDWDKHTWDNLQTSIRVRPGDNIQPPYIIPDFYASKRHVQSIQYIFSPPHRFIVTSLSDEHTNKAAIQLVYTPRFANEGKPTDVIVDQVLLTDDTEVAGFNHPGGSQLVGNYLFLALEDFTNEGDPVTGVWKVDPAQKSIDFQFAIPTTDVPHDDHHQATAAATRLSDGTFLLATCVYKHCDYINFYKSVQPSLDPAENSHLPPEFVFFDRWERHGPGGLPDDGNNWDECAPQNMNFLPQDDGTLYLVMFGAVNRGVQNGDLSGCVTGVGYDDHLFAYRVSMDQNLNISLTHTNKVDAIPKRHICAGFLLKTEVAKNLHGMNFLAGSGLWINPEGRNTIAYLATEHYDTCGASERWIVRHGVVGEGVMAKTRWGVSSNWNDRLALDVSHTNAIADEGSMAFNNGTFLPTGDGFISVSASLGSITHPGTGLWDWSWPTADGPDDSQTVTVSRFDSKGPTRSMNFELIVNNVAPTAVTGPDQVVECAPGTRVYLDASASTDPGLDTLGFSWSFTLKPDGSQPTFNDPSSPTPSFMPLKLGTHVAEVLVADEDGAYDTDDVVIEYEDTTPPVIHGISEPIMVHSSNHKWQRFEPPDFVHKVEDICDTLTLDDLRITGVASNEPANGKGDGHTETDSAISVDGTFVDLRAERSGKGNGRIYTVDVQAMDASGNATTESFEVGILHDKRR